MKFPVSIKALVAALTLAAAGSASAVTYDFASFSLDLDLTGFAGTNITKSSNGFTFDGYNIGSSGVVNVIDFTITAKAGNLFDSFSFLDEGTFTGANNKFRVTDHTLNTINTISAHSSGQWTFSAASSSVLQGAIAYDLRSNPTFSGHSTGGSFSVLTTPVPEPESYAMLLAGLGIMGAVARRAKKRS